MLIGQGKADETAIGQQLEEQDEYDADEQAVGGVDLEKEQRSKKNICMFPLNFLFIYGANDFISTFVFLTDKNMDEEMADYNGDDENEGEFEADKQAALAQI